MAQINLLDQETINQIAAGEVIDRPSSVVKELLENAIDAGATAVTIEIKEGGTSLIRITDNGSGILKEDIPKAFLRHATSKIHSVEDLLSVSSLGFRGEALSSIAAVAQVELITKTSAEASGSRYVIHGGVEKSREDIGAPEGTTFMVRNIFYNTPARRKFLKTPATEGAYISGLVERLALSRPDISIRFVNNGQIKLFTTGNHNLKDLIYMVYGKDTVANLLEVNKETPILKLSGYMGNPSLVRGNRNYENYFINGRYIQSKLVSKAIEDSYKAFLMQHKFPFTVLHIDIAAKYLDVNVHPSKMELRFRQQEEIYQSLYNALRETLDEQELIRSVSWDPEGKPDKKPEVKTEATASVMIPGIGARQSEPRHSMQGNPQNTRQGEPQHVWQGEPLESSNQAALQSTNKSEQKAANQNEQQNEHKGTDSDGSYHYDAIPKWSNRKAAQPDMIPDIQHAGMADQLRELSDYQTSESSDTAKTRYDHGNEEENAGQESKIIYNTSAEERIQSSQAPPLHYADNPVQEELFEERILTKEARPYYRVIGQLFATYWLIEYKDIFMLIDQHAAHEKVNYERIIKTLKTRDFTSQMVNPPIVMSLSAKEELLLNQHMQEFNDIGFEIEHFGGKEYAIYAVPDNLFSIAKEELFINILDQLDSEVGTLNSDMITDKIASISCKAAVKGNQQLSEAEINLLIDEMMQLDNPYACPHGRPTIISMTKYELEKKFKRIV